MKELTSLFLIFLLFSACDMKKKKDPINSAKRNTEVIQKRYPSMWGAGFQDTTVTAWLDSSTFLSYQYQGDSVYTVKWGTKNFSNSSSHNYNVVGNGVLYIDDFSNNTIVIRQGCGSPCWWSVILKVAKSAVEKEYMYPLAYDLQNSKVAYLTNEDSIILEDFNSNKRCSISTCDWCESTIKVQCFDSAYFTNDKFVMYYKGSFLTQGNPPQIKKEVKLSF